jgi:hypothetical protein
MAYLYLIAAVVIMFLVMQNRSKAFNTSVKRLVKQSAQYAITAQQDGSPVLATVHSNYAVAYLYALMDIATDAQIHRLTGIDVSKFRQHIMNVQDMVTRRTLEKVPDFAGDVDMYLAQIGGGTTK